MQLSFRELQNEVSIKGPIPAEHHISWLLPTTRTARYIRPKHIATDWEKGKINWRKENFNLCNIFKDLDRADMKLPPVHVYCVYLQFGGVETGDSIVFSTVFKRRALLTWLKFLNQGAGRELRILTYLLTYSLHGAESFLRS
jgi:hypothetical protein